MKHASPEEARAFSQMPENHFYSLLNLKIFPGEAPRPPPFASRPYGAPVLGPSATNILPPKLKVSVPLWYVQGKLINLSADKMHLPSEIVSKQSEFGIFSKLRAIGAHNVEYFVPTTLALS